MSRFISPDPEPSDEEPLSDDAERVPVSASDARDVTPATSATATPAPARLPPGEIRVIMVCLMLTMFLAALDQTIVATAIPTIGRQFHDVASLSWVVTAYLLSSTAVAPLFGTLSDIFGRRAMLITAMSLFLIGSVLCALAPSMLTLILARGLQGLGGGGIMPIVQTIIADVVTPRERGQYQAYFSMVWMTAGVGGPVVGGLFAEHLHWSMIFWINLPLGILAMALLLPRMKKIPVFHRKRKVDWVGGGLLMVSAVALLLALTWGGSRFAWLSPTILAMIGASMLLAISFIWHARRTSEPFLPLPLLGGPVVPFAIMAGAFGIGSIIGLTVTLPLYYEAVHGLSASAIGLALLPIVAASVPGAALAGYLMPRRRHYKQAAVIGTMASTLVMIAIVVVMPRSLPLMLAALSVFAFGVGSVFPVTVVSIQNAVERHETGTATGAMNFFRSLMASFAVAIFSTILLIMLGDSVSVQGEHVTTLQSVAAEDMRAAFRYVFLAAAMMMAGACLCIMRMEERPLGGPPAPVLDMAE